MEENIDEDRVRKVLNLVQSRMKSLNDVVYLTSYFWEDEIIYTPEAEAQLTEGPAVAEYLRILHKRFGMLKSFTQEELERTCGDLVSELGISFGVLAHPLRAAVTGRTASPGIFETLSLIGKERVTERLDKAIRFIEKNRLVIKLIMPDWIFKVCTNNIRCKTCAINLLEELKETIIKMEEKPWIETDR
jgi:glutamyl/glutaminyl-tRNA synthetase